MTPDPISCCGWGIIVTLSTHTPPPLEALVGMCSRIWRENENLALLPSFPLTFPTNKLFVGRCRKNKTIPSIDGWSAVSHSRCCPLGLLNLTNYSWAQIQKRSRNSCFTGLSSQQFSDYANRQNHVSGCGNTTQLSSDHPAHTASATAPFWLWSPGLIGSVCRNIKFIRASSVSLSRLYSPSLMRSPSARQLTRRLASRRGACPSQSIQGEREHRQHLRWSTHHKWWKASLKDGPHVSEWVRT